MFNYYILVIILNRKQILVISLLIVFVVGMSLAPVSASKTVKIGKYSCKLSNSDIKKIKHGKQVNKNTGKYYKYKDYSTKKMKKAKVKISVSKYAPDGGTKKGKYFVEAWSGAGPIAFKWIKL